MTTAHAQQRTQPAPATPSHSPQPAARAQVAAATLSVGAAIYGRDGRYIGRVKEASERCFLVDVRFAFDYWLSTRAVAAVHDGEVLLGIEKREVGEYLVDVDCLEDFEELDPVSERGATLDLKPVAG